MARREEESKRGSLICWRIRQKQAERTERGKLTPCQRAGWGVGGSNETPMTDEIRHLKPTTAWRWLGGGNRPGAGGPAGQRENKALWKEEKAAPVCSWRCTWGARLWLHRKHYGNSEPRAAPPKLIPFFLLQGDGCLQPLRSTMLAARQGHHYQGGLAHVLTVSGR